jgi:hypothetical protein
MLNGIATIKPNIIWHFEPVMIIVTQQSRLLHFVRNDEGLRSSLRGAQRRGNLLGIAQPADRTGQDVYQGVMCIM